MPDFRYAHATGSDWRASATACLSQLAHGAAILRFPSITGVLAVHAADLLATFQKATGIPHWVGTVGIGICATAREYLDEPAVVALVGDFEPGSFRVFSGVTSGGDVDNVA